MGMLTNYLVRLDQERLHSVRSLQQLKDIIGLSGIQTQLGCE
jgi:hypothetical protein